MAKRYLVLGLVCAVVLAVGPSPTTALVPESVSILLTGTMTALPCSISQGSFAVATLWDDGGVTVHAGDILGFDASNEGATSGIVNGCDIIPDAVASMTVNAASCSGIGGTASLDVTVVGTGLLVSSSTLQFVGSGVCVDSGLGSLNPDLNTYVGGPIQPVTLVHTEVGDQLGCFGMVKVTTTAGPFFPMEGFEAGTGPCDAANPPCDVYLALTGIVASCVAETVLSFGCCTPVFSTDVEPNTGEFLCLRSMSLGIDLESDGDDEIGGIPAATVTSSCS